MTLAIRDAGLNDWAATFGAVADVAVRLALTPFVPGSLRARREDGGGGWDQEATAANIASAILTGNELGLGPMASLRSIDVIKGTPALRALTMRALVLRAGHDMWVEESTNTRAIVCGIRKGSSHEQRSTWTLDDAKRLGLDGKENWRRIPRQMLAARATAECSRLIAPEELLGLPYSAEDLEDDSSAQSPDVRPPAPATAPRRRRTARRASAVEAAAEDVGPTPPADPAREDVPRSSPRAEAPAGGVAKWDDEPSLDEWVGDAPRPVVDVPLPADDPTPPPVRPIKPAAVPDPVPDSGPDPITPPQRGAIMAAFNGLGVRDRDDRLTMISGVVGRDVTSTNELTKDEASRLLDELLLVSGRNAIMDPPPEDDDASAPPE
jgi:hypothetical protein